MSWNSFEAPVFSCSTATTDEARKVQNLAIQKMKEAVDAREI